MPSPSVSTSAASTPSSDVPLMRPMIFWISAIRAKDPPFPNQSISCPPRPAFRSEFLRTFVERAAFYAVSEPWQELDALFQKERVTAYIGFDCTAPSMPSAISCSS